MNSFDSSTGWIKSFATNFKSSYIVCPIIIATLDVSIQMEESITYALFRRLLPTNLRYLSFVVKETFFARILYFKFKIFYAASADSSNFILSQINLEETFPKVVYHNY